nr:hypothetical protein [Tanacetum cinerariifolium]
DQENVTEEITDDVAQPTSPLPPSLDEENVFNQGRISVDIDEGIELVVNQEKDAEIEERQADTQAEIYDIDLDHSSKVLSMQEDDAEVQEVVEIVTTAKLMTEVVTTATTQVVPAAKPAVVALSKRKGVIIRDPEEELHDDTPAKTLSAKDKGKGILVEDPKPMKKKDQIEIDAEYARKLQEEEESHVQAKDVQTKDAPAKGIQYIRRYYGYKKKPQSESEARKNKIAYLKNTEGVIDSGFSRHMTRNISYLSDFEELNGGSIKLSRIQVRLKPCKKSSFSSRCRKFGSWWIYLMERGQLGNPQQALKDKGLIDSGCSRHMIGNISYLSDFKELNGGYVAFGGNPTGGKITGKGKIKTGKLDFDDVYYVKELKFNLFSVSQMCDKKNNVLFTDTECLVLSSDFKLPDASQVLLRVPRENNMYNVNLKNIIPFGDLTCLFAKAIGLPSKVFTNDLTCVACKKGKQHRASSTKDETASVLKTFIIGLEKLLSLKVKIIRCNIGTEFKNANLNQFCGLKGIKREF